MYCTVKKKKHAFLCGRFWFQVEFCADQSALMLWRCFLFRMCSALPMKGCRFIYIGKDASCSEIFMREVHRHTREITGCNRQLRATLSARPVSYFNNCQLSVLQRREDSNNVLTVCLQHAVHRTYCHLQPVLKYNRTVCNKT